MEYTVIYEKGDSTWGAYVPDSRVLLRRATLAKKLSL